MEIQLYTYIAVFFIFYRITFTFTVILHFFSFMGTENRKIVLVQK